MEVTILTIIRIFLFAMTNMMGATYIVSRVEEKRHSYWGITIFWAIKIFIQIVMCNYILVVLYGEIQWLSTLRLGVACVYAILVYAAYYWTFAGDPLHIAIIAFIADIVVSFSGFIGIAFANLFGKNSDIWLVIDEVKISDFAMPAITYSIIYVLCKISKPLLEKYKNWKPKKKKIWWTIFTVYVISVSLTNLDPYIKFTYSIIAGIVIYALSVIMFVMIVFKYENTTKKERKLLEFKQSIMENHYDIIQGQIQKMEKSREMIALQMEEIIYTDVNADSEKMKRYLEQLKSDYENIQAGIYCNDWLIDAVLCSQKRIFEIRGICFECNLYQYSRGEIKEQDLTQLLLHLFGYAENIEEAEQVSLTMKMMKNQLVIEYRITGKPKAKLSKKMLEKYLEKYDGSVEVMDRKDQVHLIIIMENRG